MILYNENKMLIVTYIKKNIIYTKLKNNEILNILLFNLYFKLLINGF